MLFHNQLLFTNKNKRMTHKAGFVNIVGNPNVGKSTLMNALVGEKMSIITSKAQTTRHRIMGIVSGDDFQIVYSDTPGVLKPNYKLQEAMLKYAESALEDADLLLYVSDVVETIDKNMAFLEKMQESHVPILLLINKIDLSSQEEVDNLYEKWQKLIPRAEIFPISALNNFNINNLFKRIIELLPEGPAFFSKDQLSDKSERFFVSEIIREKIFITYAKEIPYSVEIEVEEFKDTEKMINIRAAIHVMRDSQKGILIGHRGKAIKKVGTLARKEMENFFDKKVFLELFVKVNKEWRDKPFQLRNFGYTQ